VVDHGRIDLDVVNARQTVVLALDAVPAVRRIAVGERRARQRDARQRERDSEGCTDASALRMTNSQHR
jgi:hypothetical protein